MVLQPQYLERLQTTNDICRHKKLDVPWVELTHLVNEYIAWQENPKLALDFISNPENKMRFIGHMLCKHILEHGSILHAHKENPNR